MARLRKATALVGGEHALNRVAFVIPNEHSAFCHSERAKRGGISWAERRSFG
jgi:hypothetical protein